MFILNIYIYFNFFTRTLWQTKILYSYSVSDQKVLTKCRLHITSFDVDRLCRIWFGIAFAVFNAGFWISFNAFH